MPATAVSLQTIGDWTQGMRLPLSGILAVSMDVVGRNGDEACKHAMILMAQSAAHTTKTAKSKRPIMNDFSPTGRKKAGISSAYEYVNTYQQGKTEPTRLFKFQFQTGQLKGNWENAQKIAHAGLAKRSWMWSLGSIGGTPKSSPIPGTSRLFTILSEKVCGYVKQNRLSYILKTMPAGWEIEVQQKAGNKIMAQARDKLQREWQRTINTNARATSRTLQSFFRAVA